MVVINGVSVLKFLSDPPRILSHPSPDTKLETETVTLTCQYEGKPKSTVTWFKDGTELVTKNSSRLTVMETGDVTSTTSSLTITNLNRTDEGKYKCQVSNSIQTNVPSTEAQLTVNCKLLCLVTICRIDT